MGCKDYICEENDPCGSNAEKDELNNKAPDKQKVELSEGDTLPPPASQGEVKLGNVEWDVEFTLQKQIVAKRTGVNTSVTVNLRPESKVPTSVIDDAIKVLNGGEGRQLLDSVSDKDAIAQAVSEMSDAEWNEIMNASIGYTGGDFLVDGSKYNQPVITKKIKIDYWAVGEFEGCEEGTSEDYAKDGSPCGYGKWSVTGPLFWKRPQNPTLYSAMTAPDPYNYLQDKNAWTLAEVVAWEETNRAWFDALVNVPIYYTGPITLHAGPSEAPDSGSNGFVLGIGSTEFGPVTVYANNGDLGNNVLQLKVNAARWDIPAWFQADNPAAATWHGVTRSTSMDIDLVNGINQAPYMGQAYNDFESELGSFLGFRARIQSHVQTETQVVIQVQTEVINAPAAPSQAVQTGSVPVSGGNVKTSTEVINVGNPGKPPGCWLARAVYGENNPEWKKFRKYISEFAPKWQHELYIKYAPRLAKYIKNNNLFRLAVKSWMDKKIVKFST